PLRSRDSRAKHRTARAGSSLQACVRGSSPSRDPSTKLEGNPLATPSFMIGQCPVRLSARRRAERHCIAAPTVSRPPYKRTREPEIRAHPYARRAPVDSGQQPVAQEESGDEVDEGVRG